MDTARPTALVRRLLLLQFRLTMADILPDDLQQLLLDSRLPETPVRQALPQILKRHHSLLSSSGFLTYPHILHRLEDVLEEESNPTPFLSNVDQIDVRGLSHLRERSFQLLVHILARANRARVEFQFNPERPEPFRWVEDTLKKFEWTGQDLSRVDPLLPGGNETGSNALGTLKERLFRPRKQLPDREPVEPDDSVQWIECAHPGEELDEIARRVRKDLEAGLDPDDIGIVCKGNQRNRDDLLDALRRHDVPVFSDRPRAREHHPVVETYLLPLEFLSSVSRTSFLNALRNTLFQTDISVSPSLVEELLDECAVTGGKPSFWYTRLDRLEQQMEHRLQSVTSDEHTGFVERTEDELVFLLSRLRTFRKELETFFEKIRPGDVWADLEETARHLLECARLFGLRQNVSTEEVPDALHAEGLRTANEFHTFLLDVTGGAANLESPLSLGSPEEAEQIIRTLWEEHVRDSQSWLGPTSGVIMGEPEDLFGCPFRRVYVPGFVDGNWPESIFEHPFLEDELIRDINHLRERPLLKTSDQRRNRELYQFYRVLSMAKERLVLSWSRRDRQGREQLVSSYRDDIQSLLKDEEEYEKEPVRIKTTGADREDFFSSRDRFHYCIHALFEDQDLESLSEIGSNTPPSVEGKHQLIGMRVKAVLQRLMMGERREQFFLEPDREKRRKQADEWTGRPTDSTIPEQLGTMENYRGETIHWSPTALEQYGQCPYAFYSNRLLDLSDDSGDTLIMGPRREGKLVHKLMQNCREEMDLEQISRNELARQVRDQCESLFGEWEDLGMQGDPGFWSVKKRRIEIRVRRVLEYIADQRSGFSSIQHELSFGPGRSLDAVHLGKEKKNTPLMKVIGRMDVLEATEDGTRAAVLDYKNARNSRRYRRRTRNEHIGVHSFQLPIYLLAAKHSDLHEIEHAEEWTAGFLFLREEGKPIQIMKIRDEEEEQEGSFSYIKSRLTLGAERYTKSVREGVFDVSPDPCQTGCPYRAMCRYNNVEPDERPSPVKPEE